MNKKMMRGRGRTYLQIFFYNLSSIMVRFGAIKRSTYRSLLRFFFTYFLILLNFYFSFFTSRFTIFPILLPIYPSLLSLFPSPLPLCIPAFHSLHYLSPFHFIFLSSPQTYWKFILLDPSPRKIYTSGTSRVCRWLLSSCQRQITPAQS